MSETRTITANGYRFTYVEEGHGQPLILVHGTLGDYRTWRRQMKTFGKHFTTISYSRRYHYPEEWSKGAGEYAMSLQADDLASLISSLDASPAHLVCASWGGNVAMQTAIQQPNLVRSLILCEPPSLPLLEADRMFRHVATEFHRRTLDPACDALQANKFEDGVRIFIDGVMGDGSFEKLPNGVRRYFMQNATELKAELASPNYFAPLNKDLLRTITCPVLLVAGDRSPRLFHIILDLIEDAIPSVARISIPHASHGIHADNASAFNTAVLEFLQSMN